VKPPLTLPAGPSGIGKSLAAAALLALLLLLVTELTLRTHGAERTTTDDVNLWCRERDRLPSLGTNDVLLLGSSRMLQDFSLAAFRDRHPGRRPLQLAVDGGRPFTLLREVADETDFAGVVLCETHMSCNSRLDSPGEITQTWLNYHRREWSLNRRLNVEAQLAIRSRFAAASPSLGIVGLLRSLAAGRLEPRGAATGLDRQSLADLSRLTPAELKAIERRWASQLRPAHALQVNRGRGPWERDAREVGRMVRKIEARGGRVAFVVFPISGVMRAEYERLYPRDRFWRPFLRLTGARGLDCTQAPAFEGFHCPEGSHLDRRHSAPFTDTLCRELHALGVL
jgi:hypothetical protein